MSNKIRFRKKISMHNNQKLYKSTIKKSMKPMQSTASAKFTIISYKFDIRKASMDTKLINNLDKYKHLRLGPNCYSNYRSIKSGESNMISSIVVGGKRLKSRNRQTSQSNSRKKSKTQSFYQNEAISDGLYQSRYNNKKRFMINTDKSKKCEDRHYKSMNSTTQKDVIDRFTKDSPSDKINTQGLNILLQKNLFKDYQQYKVKRVRGRQKKILKAENSQIVIKSDDLFKKFNNDDDKDRKTIMMKFNVSHSDLMMDQHNL